jgi:hypothetical protein
MTPVETDYSTGWREGYEAASGLARLTHEGPTMELIVALDAAMTGWHVRDAEIERLRAIVQTAAAMVQHADPDLAAALLRQLEG